MAWKATIVLMSAAAIAAILPAPWSIIVFAGLVLWLLAGTIAAFGFYAYWRRNPHFSRIRHDRKWKDSVWCLKYALGGPPCVEPGLQGNQPI